MRPGEPADAVGGLVPSRVARPASVEEAAALLQETGTQAVVIRGSGSKQGWAAPPARLDLVIETAGLAGLREHAGGDLIAVVGAGTPLADLARRLAGAGQRLSLDPLFPGTTLGGAVAAGAAGPLRHRFGTARDLVVGTTVVLADGTVAHSGGRVVKNVAGYDLGKLFTGSHGTLGLLAELVVRLHPIPPARAVVRAPVAAGGAVQEAAGSVAGSFVVASAVECDLGPDGAGELVVLLESTAEAVRAQAAELSGLLAGATVSGELPGWWGVPPWSPGELGLSVAVPPGRVGAAVRLLAGTPVPEAWQLRIRGSAGLGVLGVAAAVDGDKAGTAARWLGAVREGLDALDGTAVVRALPAPLEGQVDRWGPVRGLHLMRRVKAEFDPAGRLAPGRFVGGI